MICSICGDFTTNEPYDKKKPIICSDCQYRCRGCNVRLRNGGLSEYCVRCKAAEKRQFGGGGIKIIDKTKVSGLSVSRSHLKHINSRVITHEGETLSGKKGVDYMKTQGNKYANRLKEYYK